MRRIEEEIKRAVIRASRELDDDVLKKIEKAYEEERSEAACIVLNAILENIKTAKDTGLPLCQDTGLFWCLISYGKDSEHSLSDLAEALNSALYSASLEGSFRKSIVSEPVYERENTSSNLPPVINIELIDGDKSYIDVLLKGFGSENCSSVQMLNPTAGEEGVVDAVVSMMRKAGGKPCPPVFLGVGIGGTLDRAALLSKKALFGKREHKDARYRRLEDKILERVNGLKIGAGGLGGAFTALEVNIEYEPTHIAGLPVALSLSCWADRRAHIEIGGVL